MVSKTISPEFINYLNHCQHRVQQALQNHSKVTRSPFSDNNSEILLSKLFSALNYSLLNGGKRIRPMLVYAAAETISSSKKCQKSDEVLDSIACSIEMIHSYSLVHDDLPAMDDDDLRRGKPTCHIQFDEATAILAGDALQAYAFEILCDLPLASNLKIELIRILSQASGALGMVGGQMIDLDAVDQDIDLKHLETLHRLKTGALISAAVALGATAAGANQQQLKQLNTYSRAIGLAFQVQDDILDIEGDTATLGKQQGADIAKNKPTYPALMGMQEAKTYALALKNEASEALASFGDKAKHLHQLADFIISRTQ